MSIDSPVGTSIYRLVMMAVFVLLVAALGVGLGLSVWAWVGFGGLAVGVMFWIHSYHRLLHIVSSDTLWECLVETHTQEELWQIEMDSVADLGVAIVLDGFVVTPRQQAVRFVIYQDMVDSDTYRKLKVLARF